MELTKSRARKTNDNALVESKNYAVPRKQYGYAHIPRKYASLINEHNIKYLNPYLFFHRQCAYADDVIDDKGKIKKVYNTYMTPCEKLLSIQNVEIYLKDGVTVESLKNELQRVSHLYAAKELQIEKKKLFTKIRTDMIQ